MSIKKWQVFPCDGQSVQKISKETGIPELLAVLLQARGITEPEHIRELFQSELTFSDPFLMADMRQAADRILSAVDGFEKIAVYGDYDADGVTSTAMLYSYLESCGANVLYYIPEREGEGYGLNSNAIKTLHEQQVSLIVTVDNGISSIEEVDYANSLSMDVVITDHHRPRAELPRACAVVDPYRADCKSPYKDFSGVGVAFKLIMALEGEDCDITALLDNYADLVAIGTIGDIVPLTGENRSFVKEGLRMISRTDRIGLRSLLEQAGMEGRKLTSGNIAFTIVPRINATGRIGSPDRAVRLLLTEYPDEAGELSCDINDENEYRRQIEREIYEKALQQLKEQPQRLYDRVLVIEGENWHHGVIGIVSSRITEQFGKPSIIISYSGEEARGSGRSIEGFSLFEAVRSCDRLLTRYGGHPMAAGLTLPTENISAFRKTINAYAASLDGPMPVPILKIDCLLKPQQLTLDIPEYVRALEPFGMGNPSPLFGLYHMTLSDITPVGGGKHLRVTVTQGTAAVRCMKFGTTLEQFPYSPGDLLDLAVTLEAREYNGKNTLSIYIKDLKRSDVDLDGVIAGFALYEKSKREEPLSQEELSGLIPNRNEFATVYRAVRAGNGFSGEAEILLAKIGSAQIGLGKLLTALDVLAEHHLIKMEKSGNICTVEMIHTEKKVDLFRSNILNHLYSLGKAGESYGVAANDV
ncbi:single-stranded-DNA-specific exonuclease RecJ [Caproiciproducens sp. CPB-2]|uniref:single-stranded-DNA-specific exonuclease RecJ n=1 Tax=Caproiciproducens sp. CPB-2 TaxID=3030017 RepID=UPI0023D98480|nr:single-stranded-DNA-specific exonuclease RecJ [Caproiciproducens sp. CPB-2]MDF1495764.1 single-stranded-DNA-specific exonuclease RecJ [Caproiciproducens sp. CPB-2]